MDDTTAAIWRAATLWAAEQKDLSGFQVRIDNPAPLAVCVILEWPGDYRTWLTFDSRHFVQLAFAVGETVRSDLDRRAAESRRAIAEGPPRRRGEIPG